MGPGSSRTFSRSYSTGGSGRTTPSLPGHDYASDTDVVGGYGGVPRGRLPPSTGVMGVPARGVSATRTGYPGGPRNPPTTSSRGFYPYGGGGGFDGGLMNGGLRWSYDQYNSDSEVVLGGGGAWYQGLGYGGVPTTGIASRTAPVIPQQVVVDERSFSMPHVYGGSSSGDEMGGNYVGQGVVSTAATWNGGGSAKFETMSLNSAGSGLNSTSGLGSYVGHQRTRTNSTGFLLQLSICRLRMLEILKTIIGWVCNTLSCVPFYTR